MSRAGQSCQLSPQGRSTSCSGRQSSCSGVLAEAGNVLLFLLLAALPQPCRLTSSNVRQLGIGMQVGAWQ